MALSNCDLDIIELMIVRFGIKIPDGLYDGEIGKLKFKLIQKELI
jgi:hypothetical protein